MAKVALLVAIFLVTAFDSTQAQPPQDCDPGTNAEADPNPATNSDASPDSATDADSDTDADPDSDADSDDSADANRKPSPPVSYSPPGQAETCPLQTELVHEDPVEFEPLWSGQKPGLHISGSFDIGYLFVQPNLSVGWGTPHNTWIGIELSPIANFTAFGGYAGLRWAHPNIHLRLGARYLNAYRRSYQIPENSFEARDIFVRDDTNARYWSFEAQVNLRFPIGKKLRLESQSALSYVLGVPSDRYVYDDLVRVIVKPPWVVRQRLALLYDVFEAHPGMWVGGATELIWVPNRKHWVPRVGPTVSVHITQHFQLVANLLIVAYSRDTLGLRGGVFNISLRYRAATN